MPLKLEVRYLTQLREVERIAREELSLAPPEKKQVVPVIVTNNEMD